MSKQRKICNLVLSFQKDTSLYEGSYVLECWLEEERLGKSNFVGGTVFGGAIEGCATGSCTIVGGVIIHSSILGSNIVGCAMVSVAIAGGDISGGAIKDSTIRGSNRLNHLLACHCRQHN